MFWALPPTSPSTISPVSSRRGSAAAVVRVWRAPVSRHLHAQLAPVQQRAVHGIHCVLRVPLIVEPDKGEPTALFRVPVSWDVDVPDSAVFLKNPPQRFRRRAVCQIVDF